MTALALTPVPTLSLHAAGHDRLLLIGRDCLVGLRDALAAVGVKVLVRCSWLIPCTFLGAPAEQKQDEKTTHFLLPLVVNRRVYAGAA